MMIAKLFRLLPSFKGKLRLARFLINRNAKDIIIKTRQGIFLLPNIIDHQFFELFVNGCYEKDLVKYISENLPKGGTLVDIGANIGAITFPVARMRPDVKIIAIEALPFTYRYLETNLRLNKITNVTTINACCADASDKTVKFYLDEGKNGSNSLHSLHSKSYVELITKTLDQILENLQIDKVDIIKIDTEGAEALVLKGAKKIIDGSHPEILFEFISAYEAAVPGLQAGDSQKFLLNIGYTLFHFERGVTARPISSEMTTGGTEIIGKYTRE